MRIRLLITLLPCCLLLAACNRGPASDAGVAGSAAQPAAQSSAPDASVHAPAPPASMPGNDNDAGSALPATADAVQRQRVAEIASAAALRDACEQTAPGDVDAERQRATDRLVEQGVSRAEADRLFSQSFDARMVEAGRDPEALKRACAGL